jgi:polyhydroxybutyrate depolymerase
MKSDDVGFIRAMIQQISTQYHVDKRRIYLTGIGNGASMAYIAGAQLSGQIAAIAPVSGHLWDHAVKPSSPVSLISFIGTEDPINPIKPGAEREMTGQPGRVKPQVRDSILAWATALGLSRIPKVEKLPNGVTLEQYGAVGDRAEVRFYIINGMGHGWPGDDESLTFSGMTRQSIPPLDATETIWSFFSKHPKTQ